MNQLAETHTIPTSVDKSSHVNYKEMVKEGINHIEEAGHQHWSNYNTSDSGRTILDMMCFALLDLGYKSEFPMEDILSDKQNQIITKDHFYEARDILFSNPVTTADFRKLLIDQADGIKNAWVDSITTGKGIKGLLQTSFEVSDQLKIAYLRTLTDAQRKTLNNELRQIKSGVRALLYRHRNLGEIILDPVMLKPVSYQIEGDFHLTAGIEVEEGVAQILHTLNNLCSKYIHFRTYGELSENGLTVGEIMTGPKLDNGFILDSDLKPLLKVIDVEVFRSKLLESKKIETIDSFEIQSDTQSQFGRQKKIASGTIPFFNYSQFVTQFYATDLIKIFQGHQQVSSLDQSKINAYYEALSERKPVGSYNFKNQLGPQAPNGQFRDIEGYHSIQQLFSKQFNLDVDRSYEGIPKEKRGVSKQLKGFLMLFEQIIADHQAQLANLPKLLSFDSGVKTGSKLCKTTYAQGLYNTPGSRFILKAFDNYIKLNGYRKDHPDLSWEKFKEDKYNTYEEFINNHDQNVKNIIVHKSKVLGHILARHGEKYNDRPPLVLNESYGDYSLAKAEVASSLLKQFPVYSGNMGRSYFACSHNSQKHDLLFSGLEVRMGLLYQLIDYYKGIEDLIRHSFHTYNPNLKTLVMEGGKRIRIWYHRELILDLPFTHEDKHTTIKHFLGMLKKLRAQTEGMILIDNQLILDFLQSGNWSIFQDGKRKKFTYKSQKDIEHFPLKTANRILQGAKDAGKISIGLSTRGQDEEMDVSISDHPSFQGNVGIFLPAWVCKLRDPAFIKMFERQVKNEGPAHLRYELHHLSVAHMEELLVLRKAWMKGIKNLQSGKSPGMEATIANELLLEFMVNLNRGPK